METLYLAIVLAPLLGAIVAGLFGRQVGRVGAHSVTTAGVALSFVLSLVVFWYHAMAGGAIHNETVYTWLVSDGIRFEIGFLVDNLTAMMMLVVTFVSLMVHVYTIGYMRDDPGYQRFFALISLFTFSMLMLVMANNFLQLFFGWEAVGLVSYLLIGFWFKRPSAIYANMKAFIVNRVGDFAFVLGIGAVVFHTASLDYMEVFAQADTMADATISILPGSEWSLLTVACILLFIGAMAKSAQVPLHVWLPDSMEGPTPISALIHAATMVTAGIFMVARVSPLYEYSMVALSFILIIGAITAFFMGLIGLVQNDIKRVVAYSTLSQLGYMTVALGASAYAAGIFHLTTHAFFKALLFLAAGSVIMALHHEQDMRRMGGLRKYMPITYVTALIGSLALIGFPGFSGFFSKDGIIEAVHMSSIPGASLAYVLILAGVFVTALYTFRMFFMVFHGEERFRQASGMDHGHGGHEDDHGHGHGHGGTPQESPWVVTVPLILLAIPSVLAGYFVGPLLFGDFFAEALYVDESRDVLAMLGEGYHGVLGHMVHGLMMPPFWLAMAGLGTAWFVYMKRPDLAQRARDTLPWAYNILDRKYGFDEFNDAVFAGGARRLGEWLWRFGDTLLIDTVIVNGSARAVGWVSGRLRLGQTGYLYHYAFAMIIGLLVLILAFAL
ncbi:MULTISPECIES: NADH-quinone oxidoreductase subunit L [unclassified Ectothiorhodospira]|uniref:NADH-quinone oxidoreductase subunit L n=1 Tax=unclassified Ectothiorhodospira TaxID=2684909 RepID=UPI001EE9AB0D|nr:MULTISPECIES: NADH-quinone oxidoreductase subunit L [unclassified Ectothiorhodospira]MCG5514883.1 NADH-quinone oxidoreductase subunit L [Ectothiorhodospira sp. 9100]MCG5517563.1 NADH-quinone oxidoreductase subunit L [Ectothiorhodospira sp. 9905]